MTPDEQQFCIDTLKNIGCTDPENHGQYNVVAATLYCHQCKVALTISLGDIARRTAARKAAATPNAPHTIPSAHGGKPIPVVPSHSFLAAQKKQSQNAVTMALDYKTHILVGTPHHGGTILLQVWRHLPTQAEIDQVIACDEVVCTSYALLNAVNVW